MEMYVAETQSIRVNTTIGYATAKNWFLKAQIANIQIVKIPSCTLLMKNP